MKIRLMQGWNGIAAGSIVNLGEGQAVLLIGRRQAVQHFGDEEAITVANDPDNDGRAEGGEEGEKKAFSGPPKAKRKRN